MSEDRTNSDQNRRGDAKDRVADQSAIVQVGVAAKVTSRTFWDWVERHHIDAMLVLGITLVLSVRAMEWAFNFGYADVKGTSGAERAAIIAAVLGPWGLCQGAMVKWYMELKAKNGKGATI